MYLNVPIFLVQFLEVSDFRTLISKMLLALVAAVRQRGRVIPRVHYQRIGNAIWSIVKDKRTPMI